eukprot:g3485.t1
MKFDTLVDLRKRSVELFPNNPYIGTRKEGQDEFKYTTYAEFSFLVDCFTASLANRGIRSNDKVAVISNNRLEWAVGCFATYELQALWVPMYEAQLVKDWKYIIENSGAKLACVSTPLIFDEVKAMVGKVGNLEDVICFEHSNELPSSFEHCLQIGEKLLDKAEQKSPSKRTGDDIAHLIYTSGTTGNPKGVMLTHRNISSNVQACMSLFGGTALSENDRSLSILPWAHSFGLTLELCQTMATGSSFGIVNDPRDRDQLVKDMQTVAPTILIGVPQLYYRIYDGITAKISSAPGIVQKLFNWAMGVGKKRRYAFDEGRAGKSPLVKVQWEIAKLLVLQKLKQGFGGRLRIAVTGGAALDKNVQQFFGDIGIPVIEGYGLTETSPMALAERYAPTEKLQGGLTPIPHCEVAILDPGSDQSVPMGEEGELCISGPNVMAGYYKLPEESENCMVNFEGKRYFRSGDLAKQRASGKIDITGRVKELYKLENGKYVVPGPVEDRIVLSTPLITQAFLTGANKPYNVVLLSINFDLVSSQISVEGTNLELSKNEKVRELIQSELQIASEDEKSYEFPKRFYIMESEFTVEQGFLTPKLSMKRNVIQKEFQHVIDEMYNDNESG